MRTRQLLTDRFVAVVRAGHPGVGKRLSLDQYLSLPHVQVAPRGAGWLHRRCAARAGSDPHRRPRRALLVTALQLASETDYVLTISERIAKRYEKALGLQRFEVPLKLRPYALSLVWHPRVDADAGHPFCATSSCGQRTR